MAAVLSGAVGELDIAFAGGLVGWEVVGGNECAVNKIFGGTGIDEGLHVVAVDRSVESNKYAGEVRNVGISVLGSLRRVGLWGLFANGLRDCPSGSRSACRVVGAICRTVGGLDRVVVGRQGGIDAHSPLGHDLARDAGLIFKDCRAGRVLGDEVPGN
jgi:hypothetical protein